MVPLTEWTPGSVAQQQQRKQRVENKMQRLTTAGQNSAKLLQHRVINPKGGTYASWEVALCFSFSIFCFSPSLDKEDKRASPSGGMYGSMISPAGQK